MQGLHSLNARTLGPAAFGQIGFGRSLAITKLRWVMGVLRGRELVALDGRNGNPAGAFRQVRRGASYGNARSLSGARAEKFTVGNMN